MDFAWRVEVRRWGWRGGWSEVALCGASQRGGRSRRVSVLAGEPYNSSTLRISGLQLSHSPAAFSRRRCSANKAANCAICQEYQILHSQWRPLLCSCGSRSSVMCPPRCLRLNSPLTAANSGLCRRTARRCISGPLQEPDCHSLCADRQGSAFLHLLRADCKCRRHIPDIPRLPRHARFGPYRV